MNDYRGTWISKTNQQDEISKSITVVDVQGDVCYGPNNVKISVEDLLSKYIKSDPFAAIAGSDFSQFKEFSDPVAVEKSAPTTNSIEIKTEAVTIHQEIVEIDNSPEFALFKAMKAIGTSPSEIVVDATVTIPLQLSLIKSLSTSMESLDREKFIRLMIDDSSDDILNDVAASIYNKIMT